MYNNVAGFATIEASWWIVERRKMRRNQSLLSLFNETFEAYLVWIYICMKNSRLLGCSTEADV